MDTDYDSPPHAPARSKTQVKRLYGKKARRMEIKKIGGEGGNSNHQAKESSEGDSDEQTTRRRTKSSAAKVKESGKGKGKERMQEEKEDEERPLSQGPSGKVPRASRLRSLHARNSYGQLIDEPQASLSRSMTEVPSTSSTSVTRTTDLATKLLVPPSSNQASTSEAESSGPVRKKRVVTPVALNEGENAGSAKTSSQTESTKMDSLAAKFQRTFPTLDVRAFHASTSRSPRSPRAFGDKSNIGTFPTLVETAIPRPISSASAPLQQSRPRRSSVADAPFPAYHSTHPRDSGPPSASKLTIFRDLPESSTAPFSAPPSQTTFPRFPPNLTSSHLSLDPTHRRSTLASPFGSIVSPSTSFASTVSQRPVFQFTTTVFDDPPSPSYHVDPLVPGRGGKEGDGEGMESTFVLESESCVISRREGSETASEEANVTKDSTVEMEEEMVLADESTLSIGKNSSQEANETVEAVAAIDGGGGYDPEETSQQVGIDVPGVQDSSEEAPLAVDEDSRNSVDPDFEVSKETPKPLDLDSTSHAIVKSSHDGPSTMKFAHEPSEIDANVETKRTSREPSIFTADFLPPRRARSPRYIKSSSLSSSPPQLASDEDELAYLIRTTGTHSSEDDLPIDSDLSSDEREFQTAENEVGRAVKTTSRQREKRIKATETLDKLGMRGLRIGDGKEGRRLKWKREIIEIDESETRDSTSEDELTLKRLNGVKVETKAAD